MIVLDLNKERKNKTKTVKLLRLYNGISTFMGHLKPPF